MHLLTLTGSPSPSHTLVFDGDLVDRGSWSVEILLTVFCYKCASPHFLAARSCPSRDEADAARASSPAGLYPRNVFVNRGNHETSDMNRVYGYEGESTKSASTPCLSFLHAARELTSLPQTRAEYGPQTFKLSEEIFTACASSSPSLSA